jgi:hypothetical protein
VLIPFFAFTIWIQEHKMPFIVLTLVLSYPALLIALNEYRLRIAAGRLTVSVGPIPILGGRKVIDASDIREVFWSKTSTRTGRGTVERYAIQVRALGAPVTLLDAESQSDAAIAVEAIMRWLKIYPSVRG